MGNGNGEPVVVTGPDVVGFVALLQEFASSGAKGLHRLPPIEKLKTATITMPTGSLPVGSIVGVRVGDVLVIDSGEIKERLVVEQVDWNAGHVHARPLASDEPPVDVHRETQPDPMRRALELRRTRNTGPVQLQRPPRRLGPVRR